MAPLTYDGLVVTNRRHVVRHQLLEEDEREQVADRQSDLLSGRRMQPAARGHEEGEHHGGQDDGLPEERRRPLEAQRVDDQGPGVWATQVLQAHVHRFEGGREPDSVLVVHVLDCVRTIWET